MLSKMYMNPDSLRLEVEAHCDDFKKLYVNFQAIRGCLIIKRCNRVFYSDAERDYYDKNLVNDLICNYKDLFDKYITAKHPELEWLKNEVGPYQLSQLLGVPW